MVAADASLSTIGPSYNVRLAAGLRAFDAFYVGPEVQAFGADDNYRQFRAGLHVTGLRTGEFEWSVGAGWATDTRRPRQRLRQAQRMDAALISVRRKRVTAIVMAISISPASASVS